MLSKLHYVTLLLALAGGFAGGVLAAKEFEGVTFAEQLPASAQTPALSLVGVGLREKFFVDVYLAALYAEQPSHDAAQLLSASGGVRRMQFHFVYKELPREKLTKAWQEAFAANSEQAQLDALQTRLGDFIKLHDDAYRKGDQLVLDLVPGEGVRVSSKGIAKGVIPGDDFAQAVLSAWIGNKPPSADFKKSVLGN